MPQMLYTVTYVARNLLRSGKQERIVLLDRIQVTMVMEGVSQPQQQGQITAAILMLTKLNYSSGFWQFWRLLAWLH